MRHAAIEFRQLSCSSNQKGWEKLAAPGRFPWMTSKGLESLLKSVAKVERDFSVLSATRPKKNKMRSVASLPAQDNFLPLACAISSAKRFAVTVRKSWTNDPHLEDELCHRCAIELCNGANVYDHSRRELQV